MNVSKSEANISRLFPSSINNTFPNIGSGDFVGTIELNLFNGVFINQSFSCLKNVARVMEDEREKWERVEKPIVFDVILLRFSEYVWHCGVIIGNKKMIHVMTGINSCIENYNSITWRQRVAEFRRYKNHSFA